ncbi:hypothetical protein CBS101457_003443 [Exobasidium rhododendri]|nr:hypothetical protein CBS101457_003443 [Exobasidium rhododendri]
MVTTFIPYRSPEAEDNGDDNVGSSSTNSVASVILAIRPSQSRRNALLRLIKNQEGRESILRLMQSISLLLYTTSTKKARKKQLQLLTESISTTLKFLLVGRWLMEGSNAIQDQLQQSTKGIIVRDVNGQELDKVEIVGEKQERSSSENEDAVSPEESQRQAVSAWKQMLQDGIGSLSEYLGIGADTCGLLAFFGGSGMLWNVVGGKMGIRKRRGLERVAVLSDSGFRRKYTPSGPSTAT